MKSIGSILEKVNDRLNPIVVKELRQAVQGKFLIVVLICFLCLQLLTVGLFLTDEAVKESFTAGQNVFRFLLGILLATCLLFVPAYTGIRLASERADANVDLLFITTLRPQSIIWGKFFAGLVITILLYSACLPFMTFTYLLRGVDLPSVFILLVFDFIVVAVSIQCGILIGCIPTNRIFKVILGVGWLVVTLIVFVTLLAAMFAPGGLLHSGLGSQLNSWKFWRGALGVLVGGGAFIGFLALLSIALISPLSANRALPVRIFATAVWIPTAIGAAIWSIGVNNLTPIAVWATLNILLYSIGLFVAVSEREALGQRVRRTIPRRWFLRFLGFFFYSGDAGGVAWSFLMIILTLLFISVWLIAFPQMQTEDNIRAIGALACLGLYAFSYALGASLIRRRFLANRVTGAYTWVIALILLGITTTIIPLALFFLSGNWNKEWLVASPLGPFLFSDTAGFVSNSIAIASVCAVFVGVLSLPWFIRRIGDFRPPREEAPSNPQINEPGSKYQEFGLNRVTHDPHLYTSTRLPLIFGDFGACRHLLATHPIPTLPCV